MKVTHSLRLYERTGPSGDFESAMKKSFPFVAILTQLPASHVLATFHDKLPRLSGLEDCILLDHSLLSTRQRLNVMLTCLDFRFVSDLSD
jgi:hypothetical protein